MTDQAARGPDQDGRDLGKPRELRLPRGVLVRVDVLMDGRGGISVFTRERLSGNWGDLRNEVATMIVKTGLDVLHGFRSAKMRDAEEDCDDPEESEIRPGDMPPSTTVPRLRGQEFRHIYA